VVEGENLFATNDNFNLTVDKPVVTSFSQLPIDDKPEAASSQKLLVPLRN
jgi:hypothetical protein